MKKVFVAVMVVAVGLMFAMAVHAKDEVKVKSTVTDEGSTTKMVETSPASDTDVKMEEDTSGEVTGADVEKKYKGGVQTSQGTLIKEKVKFHSYNKDNDTISVINTDGTVVTHKAKFDHTHRDYILKHYKKNDTITATYDTKLGGAIVATELAK